VSAVIERRDHTHALTAIAAVLVLVAGSWALSGRAAAFAEALAPRPSRATGACLVALAVALLASWRLKLGRPTPVLLALWLGGVALSLALAICLNVRHFATSAMSPHEAIAMGAMAVAIALSFGTGARQRQAAITVSLAGALLPWVALFGYATSITPFYALPGSPETGMAVLTATALLILSVGIMALWPEHGFIALFNSPSGGGLLLRVLLPSAVFFPIVMGWLLKVGEANGSLDRTFGFALNLGVTSVIFVLLVLWIALLFKRREADQQAAAAERERLVRELQGSLAELRLLQGRFVTVCAWTRRVLDEGKWVKFEEFLDKRLNISVSHTISDEAAEAELAAFAEEFPARDKSTP
jgi:hypothetical protein